MQMITDFIREVLIQLQGWTGNLGLSILLFTFIIRSLLIPLALPSLKSQKKMKAMQPELRKLKEKFKDDKKGYQMAQMELMKKYNANPLSGCLPQILQIALLIFLYRVLVGFLAHAEINGVPIDPHFLWLDLTKPDKTFVFPILAGITQLILSVMILPGGEIPDVVPNDAKTKQLKEANKKEEDTAEMASAMQQQMLFLMPVMTAFIALRFPSGLTLYMIATTIFSIVQQYFISGPGGLVEYSQKVVLFVKGKLNI
jgi:YidC/Oxa1 family membrane protein insertase